MDTRRLDDAVAALTREQTAWLDRDHGKELAKAPSLLNQLREAIKPGLESTGGNNDGTLAPIALNAFDLYREISEVTVWHYWRHYNGGTRTTLEEQLRAWAASARKTTTDLREAEQVITGWAHAIEALFRPARPLPIAAACPSCKQTSWHEPVDGEIIRRPALTAHGQHGAVWAECGICGARWDGGQVHDLANHIRHTA